MATLLSQLLIPFLIYSPQPYQALGFRLDLLQNDGAQEDLEEFYFH